MKSIILNEKETAPPKKFKNFAGKNIIKQYNKFLLSAVSCGYA
jgi:hypothetical protein